VEFWGIYNLLKMIQSIKFAEYEWFLWLNDFHSPMLDVVMYWITFRFTWIPLYIYVIYYIFVKIKGQPWQNLLFILVSVGLADRITSGFMKPYFARLRPCHDPIINHLVHVVGNCGGQYGFVSSHATNCFALAVSFILILKKNNIKANFLSNFLFIWAIIVSYSRIYVGVHFPSDIIIGGFVGALLPFILLPFITFIQHKIFKTYFKKYLL
jgi:undecaprenyl-diphosphatase